MQKRINPIEYAVKSKKITLRAMRCLVGKGVIQEPLGDECEAFLARLEAIWGDPEIMRCMMARMTRQRRLSIVEGADLQTRWERYILARFQAAQAAHNHNPPISKIIAEVESFFKVTPPKQLIRRIRDRARKRHTTPRKEGGRKKDPKVKKNCSTP